MNVETIPIDQIHPYTKNPRAHSDLQIREMAKSIELFGQIRPAVIDENGTILAGHGIRLALLILGRDSIDVLRKTGLSESQKKKLVLADNKLAELGSDDYEKIMGLIKELDDYEVPGYDPKVLDELLKGAVKAMEGYGTITSDKPVPQSNFFFDQSPGPSSASDPEPVQRQNNTNDHDRQPAPEPRDIIIICPHCGGEVKA